MKDQSIKPIEQITNGNVNVRTGDPERLAIIAADRQYPKQDGQLPSDVLKVNPWRNAGARWGYVEGYKAAATESASLQQRVKELEEALTYAFKWGNFDVVDDNPILRDMHHRYMNLLHSKSETSDEQPVGTFIFDFVNEKTYYMSHVTLPPVSSLPEDAVKKIWDSAAKATLAAISKCFQDNIHKAEKLSDRDVFQAVAETIENFPIPSPSLGIDP